MTKRNHIQLLYSTNAAEELGTDEQILEYYKEDLEINNCPVPDNPSIEDEAVQDYVNEVINERYLDLLTNLSFSKQWDSIIAEGDFGRWNGRSKGVYVGTFEVALRSLFTDCDDFKIEFDKERGCILTTSWHHDGTNYGTIRPLSDRGKKYFEDARNDYKSMQEIAQSILKGKMYRRAKEVF